MAFRRYAESEYAKERSYYGERIAGKAPDVGEVQPEPELVETARNHWAKADEARGDSSLERAPEEELFCLVQSKGKWTFPSTVVQNGETLDLAVKNRITGVEGGLGGNTMDTWLVTAKPIGLIREGDKRVSEGRIEWSRSCPFFEYRRPQLTFRTSSCARTFSPESPSYPRSRATASTRGLLHQRLRNACGNREMTRCGRA